MEHHARSIGRWFASLFRHLPEHGYPSEHPWRSRHDPQRPRG